MTPVDLTVHLCQETLLQNDFTNFTENVFASEVNTRPGRVA